ncbi:MAG: GNAT family N-acetyltransferase, partial [Actinomycetota bacterium]
SDPVGMLFGRLDPDSYALIIAAMWVDPAARGRGLGRKLLMTAVAWAKDSGSTAAELWVSDGNESALALYRGCGFTDTDERMPLREGSTIYVSKLRAELSQSPTQRE